MPRPTQLTLNACPICLQKLEAELKRKATSNEKQGLYQTKKHLPCPSCYSEELLLEAGITPQPDRDTLQRVFWEQGL